MDINKAELPLIMRVPGIGVESAKKIVEARRFSTLGWEHLKKIGISLQRARYFIICKGNEVLKKDLTPIQVRQQLLSLQQSKYRSDFSPQLSLF
jgi:predicted DNA-binding helix-hairpin-helix protein